MKYEWGLKWQVTLWTISLAFRDNIIITIQSQLTNKIMLSHRSTSSKRLTLPQSREAFTRRLEELQQHNRHLLSKQSARSFKRQTSTAPYPHSQSSRMLHSSRAIKRPCPDRDQSPLEFRPLTQSAPRTHNRKSISPLSVIKRQHLLEEDEQWELTPNAKAIKTNFLRKGSSIDRAILSNVLKSKINANVCPSVYSYGDVPANQHILRLIKQQIPQGMKDVVGAEEMMRMSHIMTGVRFQTLNLSQRLSSILQKHHHYAPTEEDDHLTLKSIQRW